MGSLNGREDSVGGLRQLLQGGSRKQVALKISDTQIAQRDGFLHRLDTLADQLDVEIAAEGHDRPGDRPAGPVPVNVPADRHVELDYVGLEIGQHAQTRVAGAKVIDGGDHAVTAIFLENRAQMRQIPRGLDLGDLENQMVDGKTGA